jgi:16S rRNA processing protein RimM
VLGKVEDLIETGANHVLRVVAGEGSERKERLLPFVAAVVLEVERGGERSSGRIRVDWGLDW